MLALSPTSWAHRAVHSVHCDQGGIRTACGIVIMADKVRQVGELTSMRTLHRQSVISDVSRRFCGPHNPKFSTDLGFHRADILVVVLLGAKRITDSFTTS